MQPFEGKYAKVWFLKHQDADSVRNIQKITKDI